MNKFRRYQVHDCRDVAEFLARYYRPDRYTGRGKEYAAALLESYTQEYADRGFVFISRHDSVTGRIVSLFA